MMKMICHSEKLKLTGRVLLCLHTNNETSLKETNYPQILNQNELKNRNSLLHG